jgi:hypothetical protein
MLIDPATPLWLNAKFDQPEPSRDFYLIPECGALIMIVNQSEVWIGCEQSNLREYFGNG